MDLDAARAVTPSQPVPSGHPATGHCLGGHSTDWHGCTDPTYHPAHEPRHMDTCVRPCEDCHPSPDQREAGAWIAAGMRLREAALAVLSARQSWLDALNESGHPDRPHDRELHRLTGHDDDAPCRPTDDCSACGGAQYGTEVEFNDALDALRSALGESNR